MTSSLARWRPPSGAALRPATIRIHRCLPQGAAWRGAVLLLARAQVIAVRAGQVARVHEIRKGLDFNPFVGFRSSVQARPPWQRPRTHTSTIPPPHSPPPPHPLRRSTLRTPAATQPSTCVPHRWLHQVPEELSTQPRTRACTWAASQLGAQEMRDASPSKVADKLLELTGGMAMRLAAIQPLLQTNPHLLALSQPAGPVPPARQVFDPSRPRVAPPLPPLFDFTHAHMLPELQQLIVEVRGSGGCGQQGGVSATGTLVSGAAASDRCVSLPLLDGAVAGVVDWPHNNGGGGVCVRVPVADHCRWRRCS